LARFIKTQVQYPESAAKEEIQGTVFIEFIVRKDGRLTDFKILRGVSKELNDEAMRVARLFSKWVPGKMGQRIIDTRVQVPIKFRLVESVPKTFWQRVGGWFM